MAQKTIADKIQLQKDKKLAAQALRKQKDGQDPTGREIAALRRIEKQRISDALDLVAEGIPKSKWVEWSGRQYKVLLEQAETHGAPFEGESIPLARFVRWVHDFLANNKHKLAVNSTDKDPLLAGPVSPALEEYRKWRAELAKLDVQDRTGELIARDHVHLGLGRMASILRSLGEAYQRQFEPEVYELLDSHLQDFEREMDTWFGPKGGV